MESEKNLERFMFLLSGIEDGVWDWDLEVGEFWLSDRSYTMLGYEVGELEPSFTTQIGLIHPDDLGRMLDIWTDYMEGNIPSYCLQYRLRKKDGSYLWTEARGISAKREGADEPYRLSGYHSDITVRKEQEFVIAEKTADIHNMLHNMMQGVFTITSGNKIHHEYSSYLEIILGTSDIANRDVIKLLFENSLAGVDIIDQVEVALKSIIGEDELEYDFNSHLLVNEIIKGNKEEEEDGIRDSRVILQIEWVPIIKSGIVEKILVILQNVTEIRKLAHEAQLQQEELNIIGQILKIPIGKFNGFIESANEQLIENWKLIMGSSERNLDTISVLFRNMHTVKGNARTLELVYLTDTLHEVEQYYHALREDADLPWEKDKLLVDLERATKAVDRYAQVNLIKLGRKGRASDLLTTRGVFVGNEVLDNLVTLTQQLMAQDKNSLVSGIYDDLMKISYIPFERLASGSVDSIYSLAKELEKPEPELVLLDKGAGLSHAIAEPFKSSLMHIVRNCLSHGIEMPVDRNLAGKPEKGKIIIELVACDNFAEVHISDDGRGLPLHLIYKKALANKSIMEDARLSPQEIAELIFLSGLSTAEKLSQISGRGVGMEAARAFLRKAGCEIKINFKTPIAEEAELTYTPFEFIITIPQGKYMLPS